MDANKTQTFMKHSRCLMEELDLLEKEINSQNLALLTDNFCRIFLDLPIFRE
jgi:hypothetical protein